MFQYQDLEQQTEQQRQSTLPRGISEAMREEVAQLARNLIQAEDKVRFATPPDPGSSYFKRHRL
jgi:hypothetical protein